MLLVDIFSVFLRLCEMAFAAIVAGLTGSYLHAVRHSSSGSHARFIYTEVVAGLSIVFSIIWLLPFSGSFVHWPVDGAISVAWFVSFGLLVNWLHGSCGYVFDWGGIALNADGGCSQWKANIAFCFLSAICWLVSTVLGIYWVSKHRTRVDGVAGTPVAHRRHRPVRRRWYRSRV